MVKTSESPSKLHKGSLKKHFGLRVVGKGEATWTTSPVGQTQQSHYRTGVSAWDPPGEPAASFPDLLGRPQEYVTPQGNEARRGRGNFQVCLTQGPSPKYSLRIVSDQHRIQVEDGGGGSFLTQSPGHQPWLTPACACPISGMCSSLSSHMRSPIGVLKPFYSLIYI